MRPSSFVDMNDEFDQMTVEGGISATGGERERKWYYKGDGNSID